MITPIFENTWDALRFSFYMEVLPAGNISSTYTAIKHMMRNSGKVFERVKSRINMAGLTPIEVRGQCAMVRAVVEDYLTRPERNAIWARHGIDMTHSRGVAGLADYLKDKTMSQGECLRLLVDSIYTQVDSMRKIAADYQMPRTTLREDFGRIKSAVQTLEEIAQQRLDDLFENDSLIIQYADI